jgi:hypothetical protein
MTAAGASPAPPTSGDGAAVIAAACARWGEYQWFNERDIFGTADPETVAAAVDDFCVAELGSGIGGYEFYATSVCSVHGVRLNDGRGVVVKVHRAGCDRTHLEAVHAVQRHLVSAGFPAPAPVLGPVRLAGGVAVVDELLDRDGWRDAHAPEVRRVAAAGLARQIAISRGLGAVSGLKTAALVRRQLWERPHDRRFDFGVSSAGAEWIDHFATEARRRLDVSEGPLVAGHADWRAEHLRYRDGGLSATWDWDSLSLAPEPAVVGGVAHAFVADYSVEGLACVPTLDESLAFIADYEEARGAAFTPAEVVTARAALVWYAAYSARCEHSDDLTAYGTRSPALPSGSVPPDGFRAFLARHGAALLGVSDPGAPAVAAR